MNEDFTHKLEFLQLLTEVEGKALQYGPGSLSYEQLMRLREELSQLRNGHPQHVHTLPEVVALPSLKRQHKQITSHEEDDDDVEVAVINERSGADKFDPEQTRQRAYDYAMKHDGVLILKDLTAGEPASQHQRIRGTIKHAASTWGLFKLVRKGEYRITAAGRKAAERGTPFATRGKKAPATATTENRKLNSAVTTGKPDGVSNAEWLRQEALAWAAKHHGQIKLTDFSAAFRSKYPDSADPFTLGVHGALQTLVKSGTLESEAGEGGKRLYRVSKAAAAASA